MKPFLSLAALLLVLASGLIPQHSIAKSERVGYDVVIVETVGVGQSEVAVADLVEADHAVAAVKRARPRLPGVQAGTEAVQKDHCGCRFRATVTHMQACACNIDHVCRGVQVVALQHGSAFVRRPEPPPGNGNNQASAY